ncbi:uncharacterized protein DFL_007061 [Arthrobotrys flagrans]|uniref:Ecp2 effector protein domain-containing protein n=1 Tax=Arthrobotrys flagrans TaxID=97331 RepID=A0A436ZV74_ARTFL|nr:hypothetical protein DFL_007061 [Arthrobotrys flagrans]
MRSAIILLATAAAVCAQSPLIEEYQRRYDFWLNPPSNCSTGPSGCTSPKHASDAGECSEFEDVLEDFNLSSGGDAAILTASDVACGSDQIFIVSDQVDRTRSYCCPFGRDGVISVDYGQFLNNLTIISVRCIPPVKASTGGSNTPSTTTGSSDSPARTSTGATGSSTPNSANTFRNVFALAPVAFMALAAL